MITFALNADSFSKDNDEIHSGGSGVMLYSSVPAVVLFSICMEQEC